MDIPAAHRNTAFVGRIVFDLPREYEDAWRELCRKGEKRGDWFRLVIELPKRARSTGKYSQSAHINGHCAQIAQDTGNDFTAVKMFMKTEAISQGWPYTNLPDGSVVPKSESTATVEEATILIDVIHRFAAEWNIRLKEE
jgi:hypothetical protein